MENFLVSLRCVTPVFCTLCLGIWMRWRKLAPPEFFNQLSTLCFQALLPFQLFHNIYTARLDTAFSPALLAYLEVGVLAWFALNYALFTKLIPDPRPRGAYIQNAFRSNIAVVGVSLAQSMMEADGVALVSMAIAVLVPTYNILAVITLETCRGGRADPRETVDKILKNPLIQACALGTVFLFLGIRLPAPVDRAVQNAGSAGSVITLVTLGASLRLGGVRANGKKLLIASLYRLVIAPLVLVGGAAVLGFRGGALGTVLICAASPMATTSYPMALACGSDHELTGQMVTISSLLCSLSFFFWIFGLKQLGLL